jgi:hypothetical protein
MIISWVHGLGAAGRDFWPAAKTTFSSLGWAARARLRCGRDRPVCDRTDEDHEPELPEGFVVHNRRKKEDYD